MKHLSLLLLITMSLVCGCSTEEATEHERTYDEFINSLGGNVSAQQWWRTSVTLNVNVTTDVPVKMWLLFTQNETTVLCDYKELQTSGTVTMTAPQGQGDTLSLAYVYKKKMYTQSIVLSGKAEEFVSLNTVSTSRTSTRASSPPESLCGKSIRGNAEYFQFTNPQLDDYYLMMNYSKNNVDAKVQGLNTNYELKSHGPFYITWVNVLIAHLDAVFAGNRDRIAKSLYGRKIRLFLINFFSPRDHADRGLGINACRIYRNARRGRLLPHFLICFKSVCERISLDHTAFFID